MKPSPRAGISVLAVVDTDEISLKSRGCWWYVPPGDRVTEDIDRFFAPDESESAVVTSPFDDPIWQAAFAPETPPLAFYFLGGHVGFNTRLVAWNTRGVGWTTRA